jgi:hypothetical protein
MKGHMQDGQFHPHTQYKKGTRKSRDGKINGIKIRKQRVTNFNPEGHIGDHTGFCPVCLSNITRSDKQQVRQHIKDHIQMFEHSQHEGVCDCGVRKARLENVISDAEAKEIRKGYFNKVGVSKEDDIKFTDWQKSKASDLYQIYVSKFPNSDIAREFRRGSLGHGHFGEALFEGRYADAMYRADSKNLVMLHEIGLEHFLSKVQHHPDDPSEYDTFIGRYNWAKDYRGD